MPSLKQLVSGTKKKGKMPLPPHIKHSKTQLVHKRLRQSPARPK